MPPSNENGIYKNALSRLLRRKLTNNLYKKIYVTRKLYTSARSILFIKVIQFTSRLYYTSFRLICQDDYGSFLQPLHRTINKTSRFHQNYYTAQICASQMFCTDLCKNMDIQHFEESSMLNYGEALRYQRETAGLNKSELAKALNISHQNISRWEAGSVLPNIDFCVQLADFYGITLDELVGRDHGREDR